ncbi:hypothetical protein FQK23_11930 [Corynebacterium aurimucosum]|uniref:Uncharacterized protein n=1 Tax=Corynebacterium aurimucosum TaxID=169292 RepID=A0A558GG45_9CORY|nr:hypothetical protein FQK23_11930 [Corynebacterium aurimucosum]
MSCHGTASLSHGVGAHFSVLAQDKEKGSANGGGIPWMAEQRIYLNVTKIVWWLFVPIDYVTVL